MQKEKQTYFSTSYNFLLLQVLSDIVAIHVYMLSTPMFVNAKAVLIFHNSLFWNVSK